jgi:cytochrome c oxidase cbb3-type subunit 3
MASPERDPLTGYRTTGHAWDGIKELTTPIPSWWVTVFLASCLVAVLYMWLYPSFATTGGYYRGSLGWSSESDLTDAVAAGRAAQAQWRAAIVATPIDRIETDESLRRFRDRRRAGPLSAKNCAPCHGVGCRRPDGPSFPALVDDDWLWGRHDRRDLPDDPVSASEAAMRRPATAPCRPFGEIIRRPGRSTPWAQYVRALSDPSTEASRASMSGAAIFATNCAACHGAFGRRRDAISARPRLKRCDLALWRQSGADQTADRQSTHGHDAGLREPARRRKPSARSPSTSTRWAEANVGRPSSALLDRGPTARLVRPRHPARRVGDGFPADQDLPETWRCSRSSSVSRGCGGIAGRIWRTRRSSSTCRAGGSSRFGLEFLAAGPPDRRRGHGRRGTGAVSPPTTLAGRIWCGFACPQTVWSDLLFFGRQADHPHRRARGGRRTPDARRGVVSPSPWRRRFGFVAWFNDVTAPARADPVRRRILRGLRLPSRPDGDDLHARAVCAGAGLPAHVPVAAVSRRRCSIAKASS